MDPIKTELRKALEIKGDLLKKHLFILGVLSEELFKTYNKRPILVGGGAVEFYTFGGYTTGDIDIAFDDRDAFDKLAREAGFTRHGRHWFHDELDIAIEIPTSDLAGETSPISTVEIMGKTCLIIGLEDLIIDRLNGWVHWNSEGDKEWSKNLIELNRERIDWDYLNKKALENDTKEALDQLK